MHNYVGGLTLVVFPSMTTLPNVTFAMVGILVISVESLPVLDAYCAGRDERLANLARDDSPCGLDGEALRDWQRGWDIADFALNHP